MKLAERSTWVLPDHREYEIEARDFRAVKRCLLNNSVLECSKKLDQQPLQVSYAMHSKTHADYLALRAEMAPPRMKRALTVVHR